MAFATFNEFLAMGGHAPYVWTSWAVAAALLGGIVLHARSERRQLLRNLQRRARREQRLAGGQAPVFHQRGGHDDDT